MCHLTKWSLYLALTLSVISTVGCKSKKKDYDRKLPAGSSGLRKLSPGEWPDVQLALKSVDGFDEASARSLKWFDKPSTRNFFPMEGVTHDQARASVYAFARLRQFPDVAVGQIKSEFDCYTSVGWDGSGEVLFTGYYSPIFKGSRKRTDVYKYPLYKRPTDLVSDERTGEILGREVDGMMMPYPVRQVIEEQGLLEGNELLWMDNPFDVYLVHVQGSARIDLIDEGATIFIGYNGTNGRNYASVGKLMQAEGALSNEDLSVPGMRAYFGANPDKIDYFVHQNPRYVFFREYEGDTWPAGSLGFKVGSFRTIAADKKVFPRGGVVLVDTKVSYGGNGKTRIVELMLDQDTGGAIQAAGRADIYIGIGPEAEAIAGRQYEEGRLYYFFLKPERVIYWLNQMRTSR